MGNVIECVAGADRSAVLTLRDALGAAVTSYTGSATLAATCWPGDDRPAAFAPTATWLDAAAGTIALGCAAADTATLDPGDYPVLLAITASGRTAKQVVATLRILAAPGSGTAPAVYGSYDELLRYAPWLARLKADSDQAGFAEQRARARTWFDSLIQRHWRGDRGYYGGQSPDDSLDYLYDRGRPYRTGAISTTLQGWLDAGRLVLTGPTGAAIRECVARKAIALVCAPQLGSPDKETSYQALARRFAREADALASQITAEIDTTPTPDGVGDLAIDLSASDVLYG